MENMRDDSMENKIEDAYLDEDATTPIENDNILSDNIDTDSAPSEIVDAPIEDVQVDNKSKKKKKKDKKSKRAKAESVDDATCETISNVTTTNETLGDESDKPSKKPMKKSTKITIIVISVILAIAIIATSITVPLVLIANKGKIFVSKPEDFAKTDGDTYVLNDDISIDGDLTLGNVNNIALNGKTLTVSGSLIIKNESDGKVLLGKHDGTLQASTVNITSSAEVVIDALMKVSDMNITAPSIVVDNGINVSEKVILSANTININDKFEFANAERQDILNILDSKEVNINGDVSGNVMITNPNNVKDEGYASIVNVLGAVSGDIYADKETALSVYSKITGKIDSSDRTTVDGVTTINNKIGKVKLYDKSFVKTILNASVVYVHENAIFPNMINVDSVDAIRQLARVGYITVDDSTETIMLSFGSVKGAYKYEIIIDGDAEKKIIVDPVPGGAVSCDISERVRDINKHTISVRAIAEEGDELLLDAEPLIYEYMTYTTLAKAQNIAIQSDENGVMRLTFDKVAFADEYIITINGQKVVTSEVSVDVTPYLKDGGAYIVSIIATSKNDNILRSKPSMYQYDYEVKVDSPEFTITTDGNNVIFKWTSVAHASQYYLIEVEGDTEKVVYRTASNELTIPKSDDMTNKIYKIRAVGETDYYISSDSIQITYHG